MTTEETIQFMKLDPEAVIPTRGTENSAGFDLYALADTTIVGGCGNVLVPTGIAAQAPVGTYLRVAMRSGLAVKQHLSVSAGVVDIDYTGGVGVVVYCTKMFELAKMDELPSRSPTTYDPTVCIGNTTCMDLKPHVYTIKKGERFAQLIPEKVSYGAGETVDSFCRSYSDHAGYGSTGQMVKKQ